ncbi:MAG TPA: septum formation initiator family protein [Chitinophagaceae bacterium]|nr:septum formation initiator family protein [Chitinophagaceae bacterium]
MENTSEKLNVERPFLRKGLGKPLNHLPAWLKNKYFLSITAFVVWILFFDPRDVFTQMEHRRELKELQVSKAWYQKEIAKESVEAEQLRSNPATIEKYARENYLMKRDNEDIFIIPEKPVVKNK